MAWIRRFQWAGRGLGLVALIVVALGWALGAPTAAAQTGAPTDNDVNRVARQLYCPVCESTPLDVCPTQACADWREDIRQRLAAGQTDQQIIDYFVGYYGDRVLVQPPARGFNWLIYIVPPIVLLGGVLIAWGLLRGMVRKSEPVPVPVQSDEQDEYVARLERAVREPKDGHDE